MKNIEKSIFREYDVRGIAKEQLSPELAYNLARAYNELLRKSCDKDKPRVSVGMDCRLTSEEFREAISQGLVDSGIDVLEIGVCPSPLTYFSVFHHELDGAIMITGSHNPSDYNGFKIGIGKSTIHGEAIQELYNIIQRGSFHSPTEKGKVERTEIIPPYLEYVKENVGKQARLKVVIDAGNGTASTVAPKLFEMLGADVVPLYCELDGRFPNHHPDPTVHENLKDLCQKVLEEKADFGIAFDGDSDRLGVVDETGRILFGDELMVILSRAVLKETPGAAIISEVKSSHRLYQDIEKHGGKPIMWKTGHSLIKSKLKETNAALAGEMSGHIFFNDRYFGFDDAVYSAARFYQIVSSEKKKVSELYSDLQPMVATPEIRVDCSDELKFEIVEKTKTQLTGNDYKLNPIDGIRLDFEDGWGLVRASNTQPVLVLRFEAPTESRLTEIRGVLESALNSAAKSIGHEPII